MNIFPAPLALTLLKNLPLLRGSPSDDLVALAEQCVFSHFEPDETIFYQGDPCTHVYIVQSGEVKIVYHDDDGREMIIEIIHTGEPFGGATIYLPRQPATARAASETEIISFFAEVYERVLLDHPEVALRLIRMLGQRLYALQAHNVLTGERVERRLAHILLKLARRVGRPHDEGTLIDLALSRQDLADMSGTTIETAIRLMSRFRKQVIVKTLKGGYVVIMDMEALKQLAKP